MRIGDLYSKAASLFRASPPKPRETISSSFAGGGFFGRFGFNGPNTTGVNVNERSAYSLPAFYAGVNAICSDLSALPLELVQVKDGVTRKAVEHPAYSLFSRSPDNITTSMRWRAAITSHAIVWGGGFAEITPSIDDSRLYLFLLDPSQVTIQIEPSGDVKYMTAGGALPKEKIVHLAGLSHDGITGHPLVRLARQSLGLGLAAEQFGGSYIGNGSAAAGWFKPPVELKKEARDAFLQSVDERHKGPESAGKMGLLPPGWDFQESKGGASPESAQLMELRRFSILEVARLLNCPPHRVGDYSNASYSSIEASNLQYATNTLVPWAQAFEESLALRLLSDEDVANGYQFKHDFRSILRADSQARAALYTVLFNTTAISPNEIRAMEGLNPRDGGDEYLTPLNLGTPGTTTPLPSGKMEPKK